jgi:uncharacterized protein (DUF488 family)
MIGETSSRPVYTIGHSTRSLDEFIGLLKSFDITFLVDIRSVPRSRHNPQFNQEELPASLAQAGIGYNHLKSLGGFRPVKADSINTAWRNDSFRGFADYMQTEEFHEGLLELISLAKESTLTIMCAEAVPWRCHRSLIGDALLVRQFKVIDILALGKSSPHTLTSFARVDGLEITYPSE